MKIYLKKLASKKPIPGGGSAAALVGALGVGLLEKACNFTIGKEKFKAIESDIINILKKTSTDRKRLEKLIELDQKAYLPVAKAYKLPKNTAKQQSMRKQKIEKALEGARKVPQEIIKLCEEILPYCERLEKDANQMLVGDVRCAKAFLEAAKKGAESII